VLRLQRGFSLPKGPQPSPAHPRAIAVVPRYALLSGPWLPQRRWLLPPRQPASPSTEAALTPSCECVACRVFKSCRCGHPKGLPLANINSCSAMFASQIIRLTIFLPCSVAFVLSHHLTSVLHILSQNWVHWQALALRFVWFPSPRCYFWLAARALYYT